MVEFHPYGITCPPAGVAIDPQRSVPCAVITHAHGDHARRGSARYIAHRITAAVLRLRLGARTQVAELEYGETVTMNGVRISLHPAGHLPGSAQVRLEHRGEVCVISGDYKPDDDGISTPFEPVRCHHFVTESTFGLPVFRFPPPDAVHAGINTWWRGNAARGRVSVLTGYALGKAQRLLAHLDLTIAPVSVHRAVHEVNRVLRSCGVSLPDAAVLEAGDRLPVPGSLVIMPPGASGSLLRTAGPVWTAATASGWMLLPSMRRRAGVDTGFVLSDHADWEGLNEAVAATGAERVSVVHGYAEPFARWLTERRGLDGRAPLSGTEGPEEEDAPLS